MSRYTHLESGERKARKRHVCGLCLQSIQPGWIYDYTNAIGDDGPYTWRVHPACRAIFRQWDRDDQEDFDAGEYIADGYAWPKYGPSGEVLEQPDPAKCWQCSRCGQRVTYSEIVYGLCHQCQRKDQEGGE